MKKTQSTSEIINHAKNLRRKQTNPEKLMWSILRNRQLLGLKFRRQHPIDRYIVDFYCHEASLIIELDGGQHGFDDHKPKDAVRDKFFKSKGYTVLRFWNIELRDNLDGVLLTIVNTLTPTLSQRERG